jgi:plastocyanin
VVEGPADIPVIRVAVGSEDCPMTGTRQPQTTACTAGAMSARSWRRLAGVALVGVALMLAACSSGGSATSTTGGASTATTSGGSGSSATHIVIQNFAFSPKSLTVSPGATVTVTNHDNVAHTVTSSKAGFDTGNINPGASATFTAPMTAGTYAYICSIHQYMNGTLIVSG